MLPSAHSTGSASSDCIVPSQSLSLICRGLTQLELARSQTTNRPIEVANASWATGAIVDRHLWRLSSASSSTFSTQLKIASSLAMGTVLGSASGEEDYCQKQSSVSHSLSGSTISTGNSKPSRSRLVVGEGASSAEHQATHTLGGARGDGSVLPSDAALTRSRRLP